ncbi:MAG: glutamate 5-kinase [Promethearchaeota archaeon]
MESIENLNLNNSIKRKKIWEQIRSKKRFVIKIGTNSLLEKSGDFDYETIAKLVKGVKYLLKNKKEVILVSSGAVSAGVKQIKMKNRPNDIVAQQVLAAIGNPILMQKYMQMFDDIPIAQVLLTQIDLAKRSNYLHFRNAMEKMISMGIVPIINENDVVSIDELAGTSLNPTEKEYNFSDNDVLSAIVVGAIEAEVLIILSDVDGLYTKHPNSPKAEFIEIVQNINETVKKMAGFQSKGGRGGMKTKIMAAEIASKVGAYTIITNAKKINIQKLLDDKLKCTIFLPSKALPSKKIWLIYATNADGKIQIDNGAIKAIKNGASLLLPGIVKTYGGFVEKDVVLIVDQHQNVIAKGIANYSSKVIKERLEQLKEGTLPKKTFEVISHENMEFL